MRRAPQDRDAYIEYFVRDVPADRVAAAIPCDEQRMRELAAATYDRCHHPAGTARQLAAILASGVAHGGSAVAGRPDRGDTRHGRPARAVPRRASPPRRRSRAPSSSRSPGWGTTCPASCGRASRTRWWRTGAGGAHPSRRGRSAGKLARERRASAAVELGLDQLEVTARIPPAPPRARRPNSCPVAPPPRTRSPRAARRGPVRRRPARSTALIRSSPLTTSTTPVWDPPATTRWPMPGELAPRPGRSRCSGQGSTRRAPPPPERPRRAGRALAPTARPSARSARGCRARGSSSGTAWPISIVPSWKTAARPPASRSVELEPVLARRAHGLLVSLGDRVALRERDGRPGPGDP